MYEGSKLVEELNEKHTKYYGHAFKSHAILWCVGVYTCYINSQAV